MENAQEPIDPENLNELEQKHWPQFSVINPKIGQKFVVRVNVGRVPHVMTEEHLIMWIEGYYGNRPVGKVFLKPDDQPKADFTITGKEGDLFKAYEFCNLHGLWKNEVNIKFE